MQCGTIKKNEDYQLKPEKDFSDESKGKQREERKKKKKNIAQLATQLIMQMQEGYM
jgi:hypothetical protein